VEFGAKISVSLVNGYAMVERLDWDAYNEAGDLKEAVERYKMRYGFYPERILADKIYRNRGNLQYCEKLNIRMNGPKLGRPPADKAIYAEQKWLERLDAGERNAVEGKFGEGKRCYGLGRVITRLKNTSEVSIHLTVVSRIMRTFCSRLVASCQPAVRSAATSSVRSIDSRCFMFRYSFVPQSEDSM
jgi:hypothetical protein